MLDLTQVLGTSWLGQRAYAQTLGAMRERTQTREGAFSQEIWLLEHEPVFTLGQAGRREHILAPGDIPIVQSDRGGQVTYHGPGQLIMYVLLDLRVLGVGVKAVVTALEQCVIDLLAAEGVCAERRAGAPGVYVSEKKIAALGLRVRNGRCYHGMSLNVRMDLEPFGRIDPCGYPGLEVTQLEDIGIDISVQDAGVRAAHRFTRLIAGTAGARATSRPD